MTCYREYILTECILSFHHFLLSQDSTLIATLSGRTFSKDGDDWKWWHPTVPKKLHELHDEGYVKTLFAGFVSYFDLHPCHHFSSVW